MRKESEIKATYLTEYADTIEALPLELQRNYTLIRQLDEHAEDLMRQVANEVNLLSTTELTLEARKEKLALIGQLLNESLKKGEEKFALAKSTYDTVDRHCTRLDNDLQKIEDEQLIGSGRSSNVSSLTTKQTNKRSRNLSENDDTSHTHSQKKQSSRKKSKEAQAENSITTQDDEYLSTHDAMQQAKAAATLSDLPIDPNEPLYCYCSQVSFGEMVACDNVECEIEWFHLECVGLKTPPKGKWYCKNCTAELKKKKKL